VSTKLVRRDLPILRSSCCCCSFLYPSGVFAFGFRAVDSDSDSGPTQYILATWFRFTGTGALLLASRHPRSALSITAGRQLALVDGVRRPPATSRLQLLVDGGAASRRCSRLASVGWTEEEGASQCSWLMFVWVAMTAVSLESDRP
jgi:hypothetical protein